RVRLERTKCAPWGLEDGHDALANHVYVRRADGSIQQPPTGKFEGLPLAAGEAYICETGGGGGFGNPFERPAEQVLADVRAGYVSAEAARRDYGVAVKGDPAQLDVQETQTLRSRP
ncbi:MAG TPA: hydantoinase B/oxoprolinase family protein, partial [Chloroflexota bacterium]